MILQILSRNEADVSGENVIQARLPVSLTLQIGELPCRLAYQRRFPDLHRQQIEAGPIGSSLMHDKVRPGVLVALTKLRLAAFRPRDLEALPAVSLPAIIHAIDGEMIEVEDVVFNQDIFEVVTEAMNDRILLNIAFQEISVLVTHHASGTLQRVEHPLPLMFQLRASDDCHVSDLHPDEIKHCSGAIRAVGGNI